MNTVTGAYAARLSWFVAETVKASETSSDASRPSSVVITPVAGSICKCVSVGVAECGAKVSEHQWGSIMQTTNGKNSSHDLYSE